MAASDKTVAVIGTLDTKGEEFGFLRDRLEESAGLPRVPQSRKVPSARPTL
jgi:uncharacterized protein (UPF0261 family)